MSKTEQEPIAWYYELALVYDRGAGVWLSFERRLGWDKPNVPEGSIRNLTPLYLGPLTKGVTA